MYKEAAILMYSHGGIVVVYIWVQPWSRIPRESMGAEKEQNIT